MTEYIEREAAMEICEKEYRERLRMADYCGDTVAWNIGAEIKNIPAADVAPVRRGRWLNFYGDFSTAECDICAEIYEVSPDEPCRKEFFDAFKEFYKFCPNCGAKMDLEEPV